MVGSSLSRAKRSSRSPTGRSHFWQHFAAQAVIAMENARLITEQREALEQQTATAEVLQVINSSPGNLQPVFDAMLEKAMRLCEARVRHLCDVRRRAIPSCAHRWRAGGLRANSDVHPPTGAGTGGRALVTASGHRRSLDVGDEVAIRSGDRIAAPSVDLGGARTVVDGAAAQGRCVARLLHDLSPGSAAFTDKQIALLQNFAAQAVIAMENARLITEQREALEQQTATAEVLQVINASPGDLAPVFDAILEKAHTLCAAVTGALPTYDGEFFHAVAMRGYTEGYALAMATAILPASSFHQGLLRGERVCTHHGYQDDESLGTASGYPQDHRRAPMCGPACWCRCARTAALLGFISDGAEKSARSRRKR